jgi:hypothetical protein
LTINKKEPLIVYLQRLKEFGFASSLFRWLASAHSDKRGVDQFVYPYFIAEIMKVNGLLSAEPSFFWAGNASVMPDCQL